MSRTLAAAQAAAVILATAHGWAVAGGMPSAGLAVTATVLPSRAQRLKSAQISVRQADGTLVVLSSRERAQYIDDPGSIWGDARSAPGGHLVVTVQF
jgi:hypothetical protein